MKTPIVFIIFNRPKEARLVFEAIQKIKPEKILVISDGARNNEESSLVNESRAIIDSIDWKCEVVKNYSDINLGCKKRLSSGLDWVFSLVDKAIILEDDCLPDKSFFYFCDELLNKYEHDERIMHISGNFFHTDNKSFTEVSSYYYSKIPHIWGWATWSRAWNKYDVKISDWPILKNNKKLKDVFENPGAHEYWSRVWDQYYNNKIDSWDGQWLYTCIKNKGICINPTHNLVTNIGFSNTATHTKKINTFANIPLDPVEFPLVHPNIISVTKSYDDYIFRKNFGIDNNFFYRILRPIKNRFPNLYWNIRNKIKSWTGL
jgi:hypothetical protein